MVGSVSLLGLPFSAGFYTKEYIIFVPVGRVGFLWIAVVFLTLFVQLCSIVYTARLLAVIAFGPARAAGMNSSGYVSVGRVVIPAAIRVVLVSSSCLTLVVGRALCVEELSLFQDTVFMAEVLPVLFHSGGDYTWVARSSFVLQALLVVFTLIFIVVFAHAGRGGVLRRSLLFYRGGR